jgi:hypothetical protein
MHGDRNAVADRLTGIIDLAGVQITANDFWMPQGKPVLLGNDVWDKKTIKEAELDKVTDDILSEKQRNKLKEWWLENHKNNPRTPNWDLVSTCKIYEEKGLLLIEAKAHHGELSEQDACKAGGVNRASITEAMAGINKQTGWNLSAEEHYQISNRFAWSWQLASMGVPVMLVYLGFLNADEWGDDKLKDHDDWKKSVREYSKDIVPGAIWSSKVSAGSSYFYPVIRSLTMDISFK